MHLGYVTAHVLAVDLLPGIYPGTGAVRHKAADIALVIFQGMRGTGKSCLAPPRTLQVLFNGGANQVR